MRQKEFDEYIQPGPPMKIEELEERVKVALKVYRKVKISARQILDMPYANPICKELASGNNDKIRYIMCSKYKIVY